MDEKVCDADADDEEEEVDKAANALEAAAAAAEGVAAATDHVRGNMSRVAAGVTDATRPVPEPLGRDRRAFATCSILPSEA